LLPTTNLEREAIKSDTLSLSYKDLRDQALAFAGKLRDLGYKTGDKIAMVLGENCAEHVIVQLGAAAAGVTVVSAKSPADPTLADARGIVLSATVTNDATPQGQMPHERHPPIVCHANLNYLAVGSASAALSWQAVIDSQPLDEKSICTDGSVACAVYGAAKPLTGGELLELAASMHKELGLKSEDRVVLPVPLAHAFGFGSGALATLMAGGILILPPSKDPEVLSQVIQLLGLETVLLCSTHVC
jgi:acyl-CoA synthetase (AMP-forming)/AMP-acid ligase II